MKLLGLHGRSSAWVSTGYPTVQQDALHEEFINLDLADNNFA